MKSSEKLWGRGPSEAVPCWRTKLKPRTIQAKKIRIFMLSSADDGRARRDDAIRRRVDRGKARTWRGVLFLDPFATEVEWSTIKAIADFQALDTWILFPVSAIVRMLPRSRKPDDISPGWVSRLTRVFGDQSWRELYTQSPQRNLFGDSGSERESGVDGLVSIYKTNLERLFGQRFLSTSRRLKTSTGSPLFEFMFCVGNPRGIGPATSIAGHILDRM